jgi:hypothetical protein
MTTDSRSALSRARLFLERANGAGPDQRDDFEADLEAAIVFGRAAVHRFKTEHEKHQAFKAWWALLEADPTMVFFRKERNFILKEGPPKVGQKIFAASIGPNGQDMPAPAVTTAGALYYFEDPAIPATDTVERHLVELVRLLQAAEAILS